jgi:putative addiction module component (TIGR02574 family)
MTADEVIAIARTMSPDDRAWIIASIDPADDKPALTEALKAELDQRWDAYEADPKAVFTWEEVEAELDADQ